MRFTKDQIDILRQTPMRDILAVEGFDTSHTMGGLFFSPFRAKERTPSLHIDDRQHKWYDHGDPSAGLSGNGGGDTISFVQRLRGCGFYEALEYLCQYNPSVVPSQDIKPVSVPRRDDRIVGDGGGSVRRAEVRIDEVLDRFEDSGLISYAEGRGIGERVLNAVCREVRYTVILTGGGSMPDKEYRHAAIGFPNSSGGWTLRYPPKGRRNDKGKRSTGGGHTAVDVHGNVIMRDDLTATAAGVVVFEGFMDYMSWLVMSRPEGVPVDCDVVVLNSVGNLKGALPFILMHRNVIGLLDADSAGDAATALLKDACADGSRFYDMRGRVLRGHKDVNDRLRADLKKGNS